MNSIARASEKQTVGRHIDELNLARLGLISMQTRISSEATSWEDTFSYGDEICSVKCVGTSEYLVPHGTDNDVMIGILCLFAAQGFPESNVVTATANQFLRASGLDVSGRYHRGLQESLMRLSHSNFHIERGWHDGGRFRTVIFRHLHEIIFDTESAGGPIDHESRITVVLPPVIAESLRRGYLKPLSTSILGELRQPTSRALYRLLDGHRHDLTDPTKRLSELQIGLLELGRKSRILDLRPDKIRRVLDPAHKELLATGYLSAANYEGRGRNQVIHYIFEEEVASLDPVLMNRLTGRGIAPKVARNLVESLGIDVVRERLDEVDRMVKGKKTPGPGFFVNFLRRPEDYRQKHADTSTGTTLAAQPTNLPQRSLMAVDPDEEERRRFVQLSPVQQAQETVRSLRVVYRSQLSPEEYAKLLEVLEIQALDGAVLRAEAAGALAAGRSAEVAADLRARLAEF